MPDSRGRSCWGATVTITGVVVLDSELLETLITASRTCGIRALEIGILVICGNAGSCSERWCDW